MSKKSKGLGDTVAKVTKVTGIEKAVKAVLGEDCGGCNKRREALNRLFPYKSDKQLTAHDVERWEYFKSNFDNKLLQPADQDLIIELINKLGYSFTSCKTCSSAVWKRHIESIDKYVKNVEYGT